jgi:hypothetical protein
MRLRLLGGKPQLQRVAIVVIREDLLSLFPSRVVPSWRAVSLQRRSQIAQPAQMWMNQRVCDSSSTETVNRDSA